MKFEKRECNVIINKIIIWHSLFHIYSRLALSTLFPDFQSSGL